jgi:outer membrane protein
MTGRYLIPLFAAVIIFGTSPGRAQSTSPVPAGPPAAESGSMDHAAAPLPAAPLAPHVATLRALQLPQAPGAGGETYAPQAGSAPGDQSLTLQDAEKIAVQNHPQIQIAQHRAASAAAQIQEVQSIYFPQATGNVTGVASENNSRIDSGALNNPIIYDRFATGAYISQFVTDFGRTHELVKSSSLHARAAQEGVEASRADVLLQVHEAFFGVLKSQAVLTVAQETVKDRQLIADQIGLMAKNQLKSGLDVAFANVDLSQAQLLLIQAQNDVQASFAQFSAALGFREPRTFVLSESPMPPAPPADFVEVLQAAFQNRPELISQRFDVDSAHSYAVAERDLWFPTLNGAGAAGLTPYRQSELASRYAAIGFDLSIPLFNGHLFGSLRTQAREEFRAQQQSLRDLEDRVARDVRTAWLNANSAFQRLSVTEELLREATLAEDLAASRYRMGLSSIVELTQAQLNMTQAQIAEASAKYDYHARISELLYQQGLLR